MDKVPTNKRGLVTSQDVSLDKEYIEWIHELKSSIGKGNVITILNFAFKPTAVRYAWKDNPLQANVRSLTGLPMSSFELTF